MVHFANTKGIKMNENKKILKVISVANEFDKSFQKLVENMHDIVSPKNDEEWQKLALFTFASVALSLLRFNGNNKDGAISDLKTIEKIIKSESMEITISSSFLPENFTKH